MLLGRFFANLLRDRVLLHFFDVARCASLHFFILLQKNKQWYFCLGQSVLEKYFLLVSEATHD